MVPSSSKNYRLAVPYLALTFVLVFGLIIGTIPQGAVAAGTFADPAMQSVWNRTDQPVAAQKASRTWMWGPESFATTQEAYVEAPGGMRTVSYFDKSRMEVTNPDGDRNSQWFITNGLLAKELITGKMQVGDNAFEDKWPAEIPVAGDPDDANGPTYATLSNVLSFAGEHKAAVMDTIDRAGNVGQNGALGNYTDYVTFIPETGHNIPRVFWDFLNSTGTVSDDGQNKQGKLFDPTFFATGFPITEAYWARVKVGGQVRDVLVQAYERRVLTYTPTNPPGWQVEMGNVGRHYYDWRYNGAGAPPVSITPTPPVVNDPAAGLPADINGSISPKYGPAGTVFIIKVSGFKPNEMVSYWINTTSGALDGTNQSLTVGPDGGAMNVPIPTGVDTQPGAYSFVFQSRETGHRSVLNFKIVPRNEMPTTDPMADLPQGWSTLDDPAGYRLGLPSGWKGALRNTPEMEDFIGMVQKSDNGLAEFYRIALKKGILRDETSDWIVRDTIGFLLSYDRGFLLSQSYDTAQDAQGTGGMYPGAAVFRFELKEKVTVDEYALAVIFNLEDREFLASPITQERFATPSGDVVVLKFQTYRHVGLSNTCNTLVLSVQGTNGYQLLMNATAEQQAKYQPLFDQMVQHYQIPPAQ